MCSAPDVEEPTRYQQAKEPEYSADQRDGKKSRGRAGTILTPASGGMGMQATGGKKTLLGQ